MLFVFQLVFAGYLCVVCGETIVTSYNDTISLVCDHNESVETVIMARWKFDDKYKDNEEDVLYQVFGEDTPKYSGNLTEDRVVSWNYSTGNLIIDGLDCWGDQRYTCQIFVNRLIDIAEHKVKLGRPAEEPYVSIRAGSTTVMLAPGQQCQQLPGTDETSILVESSVRSNPARKLFYQWKRSE